MKSQHSIDFLDRLQGEFDKTYSEENYNKFLGRLSGYSRDVLDRTYAEIVKTCERLPTFAHISKAIAAVIPQIESAPRNPVDEKMRRVDMLITRWSGQFQSSDIMARATRLGIEWPIYQYARAMAGTQAWLIEQGNAPGYGDFDNSAVFNREEFNARKSWYDDFCKNQALTGIIEIIVPEYVFDYHLRRQARG